MKNLKQEAINCAKKILKAKLDSLNQQMSELDESLLTETKSSVGDKHETARARMQAEQGKLKQQIGQVEIQLQELNNLGEMSPSKQIATGSLVTTSRGIFFIGPPIGKVSVETRDVYFLSLQSPLGKLFNSQAAGKAVAINGVNYEIENVE